MSDNVWLSLLRLLAPLKKEVNEFEGHQEGCLASSSTFKEIASGQLNAKRRYKCFVSVTAMGFLCFMTASQVLIRFFGLGQYLPGWVSVSYLEWMGEESTTFSLAVTAICTLGGVATQLIVLHDEKGGPGLLSCLSVLQEEGDVGMDETSIGDLTWTMRWVNRLFKFVRFAAAPAILLLHGIICCLTCNEAMQTERYDLLISCVIQFAIAFAGALFGIPAIIAPAFHMAVGADFQRKQLNTLARRITSLLDGSHGGGVPVTHPASNPDPEPEPAPQYIPLNRWAMPSYGTSSVTGGSREPAVAILELSQNIPTAAGSSLAASVSGKNTSVIREDDQDWINREARAIQQDVAAMRRRTVRMDKTGRKVMVVFLCSLALLTACAFGVLYLHAGFLRTMTQILVLAPDLAGLILLLCLVDVSGARRAVVLALGALAAFAPDMDPEVRVTMNMLAQHLERGEDGFTVGGELTYTRLTLWTFLTGGFSFLLLVLNFAGTLKSTAGVMHICGNFTITTSYY